MPPPCFYSGPSDLQTNAQGRRNDALRQGVQPNNAVRLHLDLAIQGWGQWKTFPKKGGWPTSNPAIDGCFYLSNTYIYIWYMYILYAYSSMFNSCSNIIFQNVLLGYPFSNSKEWLRDITWHVSVWRLGIPSNGHLLGKMTAKNTGSLGCPIFIQTQIWDCWRMLNIYIYIYYIYIHRTLVPSEPQNSW